MSFIHRIIVLIFISISLNLPLVAQESTISTDTGVEQVEVDAAIATKMRDILGELEAYQDVTVTVNAGIVTLRGTTLEASGHDQLQELAGRVEGVIAIENQVTISTDITERLSPAMERFLERIKQLMAFLPLILVGLIAFGVVVTFGFLLARLRQPWESLAPNAFIAEIYRTIVRLFSIIGGLVVALDIVGATALLSTIMGAAGIIGLALGFAVRDTVENFIASLLLSIRQPFRPNDTIEINGDTGKVIRLTSRATILLSFDGNHIRIPNATVFKSRIINYTRNRERRFGFEVYVSDVTDLPDAMKRAKERLAALPFVLNSPEPSGWFEYVNEHGARLGFTAWINQRETGLSNARGEAMRAVVAELSPNGVVQIAGEENTKAMDEDALDQLVQSDRDANRASDLLDDKSREE